MQPNNCVSLFLWLSCHWKVFFGMYFKMKWWVVSVVVLLVFWQKDLLSKADCPRMCAYKLVTVKFKWWGLQTRVENLIHEVRLMFIATLSWLPSHKCTISALTYMTTVVHSKRRGFLQIFTGSFFVQLISGWILPWMTSERWRQRHRRNWKQ